MEPDFETFAKFNENCDSRNVGVAENMGPILHLQHKIMKPNGGEQNGFSS